MKVGFDAYWWLDGPPSGRGVLRSIVSTWAEDYPADELTLIVPRRQMRVAAHQLSDSSGARIILRPTSAPLHALAAAANNLRVDALLTQNFAAVAPRSALSAVFVHDLIFRRHPEWFTFAERMYLAPLVPLLSRAHVVLTSSASEAKHLESARPSARVVPVGLSTPVDFLEAVPSDPGLTARDFILTVGRVNKRKNLKRLISALSKYGIISKTLPLIVVGEADGARESIAPTAAGSVIWAGFVTNQELKWLYHNARLFVFPSLDEGFGLPIAEAARCGTPTAASNIEAFRELGTTRRYFDPHDEEDMARVVSDALQRAEAPGAFEHSWHDVVAGIRASFSGGSSV